MRMIDNSQKNITNGYNLMFSSLTFQISTKVTLGLGGVLIVLVSVGAAVGFYGYVGIPCTMLIIEVRQEEESTEGRRKEGCVGLLVPLIFPSLLYSKG